MKFRIVLAVVLALFSFHLAAHAQVTISEEKHKLISEFVRLTKMDQLMSGITESMLKEMEKNYPKSYGAVIDARNDIPDAEKEKLKAAVGTAYVNFSQKVRKRLPASIDYSKYIEESIFPIYNKFYSEQELRDIIQFYRSPTGQKVLDTQMQLFVEAQNAASEKLVPQLTSVIQDLLKEDFENVGRPPAKSRNKE